MLEMLEMLETMLEAKLDFASYLFKILIFGFKFCVILGGGRNCCNIFFNQRLFNIVPILLIYSLSSKISNFFFSFHMEGFLRFSLFVLFFPRLPFAVVIPFLNRDNPN